MFSARSASFLGFFRPLRRRHSAKDGYALSRARNLLHRIADFAPCRFREAYAEAFLRRAGAPAPAAEHAFQYRLSIAQGKAEATVAKGADIFYARQYRQFLNPTMGAFAMTATHAALAAGAPGSGLRGRRTAHMAMNESLCGARPIIVLDRQCVATPIYLPAPRNAAEARALSHWLSGSGPAPDACRSQMLGDDLDCAEEGARASLQSATGAMLQLVDAALRSRRLAILALHPYDPDAMGLHVTLFGVEALTAKALQRDHALTPQALAPWRRAAQEQGALLYFLVGGVEEAFTQCSQNLFVKRCAPASSRRARWPHAWTPKQPLAELVARQFELLQATVSSTGLPGLSPRNGDIGLAGFVIRDKGGAAILIPYFAGNAVHGHAAKLWSNPEGALMIWDDHSALSAVTLRGPARVVSQAFVVRRFPDVAAQVASRQRRNGAPADAPEYWFMQRVAEIAVRDEPVAANHLDPARTTCSIHAAGGALHGKKPAYFAADELPPYDMAWQHAREHVGRPKDPSGAEAGVWEEAFSAALETRLMHLANVRHCERSEAVQSRAP